MFIGGLIIVDVDAVAYEQSCIENAIAVQGLPTSVRAMIAAKVKDDFQALERIAERNNLDIIWKESKQRAGDSWSVYFSISLSPVGRAIEQEK